MLIEILIKTNTSNELLNKEDVAYTEMTLAIDCIQCIMRGPVDEECFLFTTTGDDYVVKMTYQEMVTLWRKAIDMSSESCLIKAECNPAIKHSMN
jgi:hypothetical protein